MTGADIIFEKSLPEPNSGCWIWLGEHRVSDGYGECWAFGKRERAHQASFREHGGIVPSGMVLRHTCDTRCCVNPDHLIVGTQADNYYDMVERGRRPQGSGHSNAKLTEDDVRYIRTSSEPKRAMARKFGVSQMLIIRVIARKCWKHI